jgi:hypothetical protein
MQRYKIYLPFLFFLIIITSCKKDFLEVNNPNLITKDFNVTDLTTSSNYLNGIYVNIAQDLFIYGAITGYPEVIADNLKPVTSTSSIFLPHYSWIQSSSKGFSNPLSTTNVNKFWLNGYGILHSCTFLVEKAEEYRGENPVKADDLKAQALTLKAYVNFLLVNIFAQSYNYTADASHPGIPVVTSSDWSLPINSRQTVKEDYDQMISDLNTAISLFQPSSTSVLYMNKNAAKALLARVYLFKGDYAAAKNLAREVGTAVPIMQASANGYPSKLFTDKESEALFQLAPSQGGLSLPSPNGSYTGGYNTNYLGVLFVSPKYFIATNDIATILTQNPSDLRKSWISGSVGVYNVNKYPQGIIAGFTTPSASYYQTVLRSSEMYLTAAEAYAKISNEDSSRYYLNQIRTRAGLVSLTNTVSGTGLLDSIYLERRRELCFEGLRMFDLLRWKKGVDRADAWSATVKSLPYPSNKAIAPLPQQDVDMYQISQNDDY